MPSLADFKTHPLKTAYAYAARWVGKYKRPKRYDRMLQIIDEVKPKVLLEVGTLHGWHAKKMIAIAQKYHPKGEVQYLGFDLFEPMGQAQFAYEVSKQPDTEAVLQRRLEETGAAIRLFKGDTVETLPRVYNQLPPVDFAFIDGGHSLQTIANDWKYVSRAMRPGGIVIFDDYWPDRTDAGAKVTVDSIDRTQFDVEVLPTVDVFINPDHGKLTLQLAMARKK